MLDPETGRAWRRLKKEIVENAPIVFRGVAREGKHLSRKVYSAVVRGSKSLIRRAKGWRAPFHGVKPLVTQLARVRLRSPIYKV